MKPAAIRKAKPAKKKSKVKEKPSARKKPIAKKKLVTKSSPATRKKSGAKRKPVTKPATAKKSVAKTKRKSGGTKNARVKAILEELEKKYPNARCALEHKSAFQLLVATILSAQCTDARVNKVAPGLFEKYPTPTAFAGLKQEVLEQEIRSTGFFRNKAKNIIGAAKKIVKDFNGEVPQSMDEMLTLPGVARKTANVVLGTAFGEATGVVVDTHVFRIAHRLKLSNGKTPEKVEEDLKGLIREERWILFGHQVILFGREICQARKPFCITCPLITICDSPDKTA